jgi:hypothetical protein
MNDGVRLRNNCTSSLKKKKVKPQQWALSSSEMLSLKNVGLQEFRSDFLLTLEPRQRIRYSEWLRAGRPRGSSSSLCGIKDLLPSTSSRSALEPTQPPIEGVPRALSTGVKRPGCKTGHWSQASAVVKKTWIYTSTPHTSSWHSV